jgi:hypothetical protein
MKTKQIALDLPVYYWRLFFLAVAALALLFLAACAPASPAAPTGGQEQTPTATDEPGNTPPPAGSFSPQFLEQFQPEDVVLQLAYEPTFTLPDWRYEFGRVPPFTLLADGRVIYEDEHQDMQVMVAQLSPEETAALLQQVHDLGYPRLESHTDMCAPEVNGEQMCVADASFTLLRARMPDGELREIRSYANFSNDSVAFDAIYELLANYYASSALKYVPEGATLFISPLENADGQNPREWVLDEAYLANSESTHMMLWATPLTGAELNQYLGQLTSLSGYQAFEHEGRFYNARLVPWLPGMDYSDEIRAEFP